MAFFLFFCHRNFFIFFLKIPLYFIYVYSMFSARRRNFLKKGLVIVAFYILGKYIKKPAFLQEKEYLFFFNILYKLCIILGPIIIRHSPEIVVTATPLSLNTFKLVMLNSATYTWNSEIANNTIPTNVSVIPIFFFICSYLLEFSQSILFFRLLPMYYYYIIF